MVKNACELYRDASIDLYRRGMVLARDLADAIYKAIGEHPEDDLEEGGVEGFFPIEMRYLWGVYFIVNIHEFDVVLENVDSENYDEKVEEASGYSDMTVEKLERRDRKELQPVIHAIHDILIERDIDTFSYQTSANEKGEVIISGIKSIKTQNEMNRYASLRKEAAKWQDAQPGINSIFTQAMNNVLRDEFAEVKKTKADAKKRTKPVKSAIALKYEKETGLRCFYRGVETRQYAKWRKTHRS